LGCFGLFSGHDGVIGRWPCMLWHTEKPNSWVSRFLDRSTVGHEILDLCRVRLFRTRPKADWASSRRCRLFVKNTSAVTKDPI
jgi:hypothetical protein